jgi:hypothetical protein
MRMDETNDTRIDENEMEPPREHPAIERFRGDCMLFLDFNRPVLLEEVDRFIWSATNDELPTLRKAIAERTKVLRARPGRRGRPRGDRDEKQKRRNFKVAWRHHVVEQTWRQIAEADGLRPTKENFRTLQRRRDSYAAVVWDALRNALSGADPSPERIKLALEDLKTQQWLQGEAGLPFGVAPGECKALVETLVPFGRKESGNEFGRRFDYLVNKRAAGASVK